MQSIRTIANTFLAVAVVTFLLPACKKENNTPVNVVEVVPMGTVLASGSFVSNVHNTSGTVKVTQDGMGKKFLVFENFKTDNGPDLRVWLSPNNSASSYVQVGTLRAVSGNFSYELTPAINYSTNNRVLIWCEDFSVLFGHAVLQ